jgi:hypothetical protein
LGIGQGVKKVLTVKICDVTKHFIRHRTVFMTWSSVSPTNVLNYLVEASMFLHSSP